MGLPTFQGRIERALWADSIPLLPPTSWEVPHKRPLVQGQQSPWRDCHPPGWEQLSRGVREGLLRLLPRGHQLA